MPQVKPVYLQSVSGKIIELLPAHKAIVEFSYNNTTQRALLWANRLMINNKLPLVREDIREYLSVDSKVTFKCHALDATGRDNCGWFIVQAVRQELHDREMNADFHFGVVNGTGTPSVLTPRQGVLDFVCDEYICDSLHYKYQQVEGVTQTVLFQASKIYLYSKRLTSKQRVDKVMQLDVDYNFDAIPINPLENDYGCSWLATAVWKGNRPDDVRSVLTEPGEVPQDLVSEMKSVAYLPKGLFWRGYGHVWAVINDEFALILGRLKANQYDTVLLHRSFFTISKHRVTSVSLHKLLTKGDRLQFVAAPAPDKFFVRWIASHVSPDMDGHSKTSINVVL